MDWPGTPLAVTQEVPVDACRLWMLKPIREPLQEGLTLGLRLGSAGEMESAGNRKFADLARAR
jgi:hypothetical protein